MDTEYDRKFEEMKKYIPFLENMITRLESTSGSSSNPRQAQLDKIRSLRDLLSNKKKRMKMENLLKCEQVLVNLYAKVEQRDTLASVQKPSDSGFSIDAPTPKEKSELEAVRNKLKTVVQLQDKVQDTLPEILPRSGVSNVLTSGTKEPALFHRRPNQQPIPSNKQDDEKSASPPGSASKRNYTRVLVSPESDSRRWSPSQTNAEKPLFSRRSPRKSPRRHSPSYHKKERKKSKSSQKRRDLNITLNVPEESLNSLNTKDILSRIINCSDGDVDIATLRELRKQILGELQKTGAKDDISDFILKSYNNKKNTKENKKKEVEEGELSDSESEAIESIYGSLVVKEPVQHLSDKDAQPRKIQICLVINSDEKSETKQINTPNNDVTSDSAELVMYEKDKDQKLNLGSEKNRQDEKKSDAKKETNKTSSSLECAKASKDIISLENKEKESPRVSATAEVSKDTAAPTKPNDPLTPSKNVSSTEQKEVVVAPNETVPFKANFYKPLTTEQSTSELSESFSNNNEISEEKDKSLTSLPDNENTLNRAKTPEIPLLHDRTIEQKPADSTLSEIDILQALKNEILSDISMPGTDTSTPLLHQPKLTKVASAQEILPKKRISIEKYKEKSVVSGKSHTEQVSHKEDSLKKSSLKLTEKECERFNIPKISFDEEDESLDEDGDILASDVYNDVYSDLAPKSPDDDESSNIGSAPPVIIPIDPVKTLPVNYKADVDMRSLPLLSPSKTINNDMYSNKKNGDNPEQIRTTPLVDPRVRNINTNMSNQSPKALASNTDKSGSFIGMSSGNVSNHKMTSSPRVYEMTPTHQSFEIEHTSRKNVYVPIINNYDNREKETGERRSRIDDGREWNPQRENLNRSKNDRYHVDNREEVYKRSDVTNKASTQSYARPEGQVANHLGRNDCPNTPSHPFGRLECPSTPSHSFGRLECPNTPSHPFGRSDCPPTPGHPFGRSECPPTPSHPFGRSECPPTPSHPFGRLDCPSTPSHPFGRSECPPTPSHPFGRSECPPTPSHPFGRSECPPTPSHPFGRSECPPTPSHPFGRSECPPTPSHPFGRLDCPSTPSHPFGRSECPSTPSHPFGRSECPPTPSHPFGRSECPMPSHPFGRSERPPTANHPFSRNEAPPPPMHNRIDRSATPTQGFERTSTMIEQNLSHKFSKSDYPYGFDAGHKSVNLSNNHFGRSDFNNQKYVKDPRLNRNLESDSISGYDERERGYYKDRNRYGGGSYSSRKSYEGGDQFQSYNRDHGSRHGKYYPAEARSTYNSDQDRQARSSSRSISKDYESDGTRFKEGFHEEERSRRERSIGRNVPLENRPSTKPSIGRQFSRDLEPNTLSVKSNAGRSFTIDTSVSSTFQKYTSETENMAEFTNSFNTRRQRAASVGRSLSGESSIGRPLGRDSSVGRTFGRESSVGRIFGQESSVGRSLGRESSVGRSLGRESSIGRTFVTDHKSFNNSGEDKRDAFRRASSVGREVLSSKNDKRTFQEIKADFKSYKFSSNDLSKSTVSRPSYGEKYSGRSRKDLHEGEKSQRRDQEYLKSSYSPRKNYRDPRMRRQFENRNDTYSRHERKSGIVYSNDNIVTGSILTSGYGVKNYKIPKIKRTNEEKEVVEDQLEDEKKLETEKEQKDKSNLSEKTKPVINEKVNKEKQRGKEKSKTGAKEKREEVRENVKISNKLEPDSEELDSSCERRLTRSLRKSMTVINSGTDIIKKTKKTKNRNDDSTADREKDRDLESITSTEDSNFEENDFIASDYVNSSKADKDDISKEDKCIKLKGPEIGSSNKDKKVALTEPNPSFAIDDLEMFSDNIVSDPVIDNINALIDDLDNDLRSSKNDSQFTNEITLENMMQNISSPKKDSLTETEDNTSKIIEAIDMISKEEESQELLDKKQLPEEKDILTTAKSDLSNEKDKSSLEDSVNNMATQSDAICSNDSDKPKDLINSPKIIKSTEHIDSTTEIEKLNQLEDKSAKDELHTDGCSTPDSTINTDENVLKLTNEDSLPGCTNEVTSTETIEHKSNVSTSKETVPGLDSLGNLLSILQDKSKIKELLNMLGSQSMDNEKIKKKLEKLSEIVSDDEEENSTQVPTTQKDSTETIGGEETNEIVLENLEDNKINENSSCVLNENDTKQDDEDSKVSDQNSEVLETNVETQNNEQKQLKKKPTKKTKAMKKGKYKQKKVNSTAEKRVTRAATAEIKPKVKKPPRELAMLQEDIKDMFIRDEVLSATGIRMCRLAKLIDEKTSSPAATSKEDLSLSEVGPIVVIEKCKNIGPETLKDNETVKNIPETGKKKKLGVKAKAKAMNDSETSKNKTVLKTKPGPKSKTKHKKDSDPYAFEIDSISDMNIEKRSEDDSSSSFDSESDSLASSKSYESTELLVDLKKKTKRKRRSWQLGVIKSKSKKKKSVLKQAEPIQANLELLLSEKTSIPDLTCCTDRNYCFKKNQLSYTCRLCEFYGNDIVLHYRNEHPHVEIPLSRMSPEAAIEAIDQCEEINFKAISKIISEKYTCIFCFKEFPNVTRKRKSVLEAFFWHIVSTHTGEYKKKCSTCVDENQCPFNLDIPPPPKDYEGQLTGYICKKCNFTQISLENLKTHVIVRHNDEQTAVYTINLSAMNREALNSLLRLCIMDDTVLDTNTDNSENRLVVQSREKQRRSIEERNRDNVKIRTIAKQVNQPVTPIQSKLTFEGDDVSEQSDLRNDDEMNIKVEKIDSETSSNLPINEESPLTGTKDIDTASEEPESQMPNQDPKSTNEPSNDIFDIAHFKVNETQSGTKEYCCCVNGNYHFKSPLLISMKRHVQLKHCEIWDGYCYVCKVIVTPQGIHDFKDCWQHYLDKHMDSFPILEEENIESLTAPTPPLNIDPVAQSPKPYINVRPLSELITVSEQPRSEENAGFPIIQSVMSLGAPEEPSRLSPVYVPPLQGETINPLYKYEEHQAEIVSKKYYLVNQTMMTRDKLIKVFKCSGRFCSYATDSTVQALAHATTHQRIGGTESLSCSYCNFDSAGNAVDLVTHVFKHHGNCPYCCQQCMYRAASSQAVGAHIGKTHGLSSVPLTVLRVTNAPAISAIKPTMLTREQSVSYYYCGHKDRDEPCKFRTYTPDKFIEHLVQRHSDSTGHPCHECSLVVPNSGELVQHMKEHGIKLYQCTWCVHGADNESELLSHISVLHPDKQPQAYIRIITNKDGAMGPRVLPLAFLNKHKVPTVDVTSTPTEEDPVREAERSIEMEALIGPFLNNTLNTPINLDSPETAIDTSDIPEVINPSREIITPRDTKPPENVPIAEPHTHTPEIAVPSSSAVSASSIANQETVVKTEPVEKEIPVSAVVVLDSDDEDTSSVSTPQQPIIDLSEESSSTSKEKVISKVVPPKNLLFICPICKILFKNMGGLKKHTLSCAAHSKLTSIYNCPHCSHTTDNLRKLLNHYVGEHTENYLYECGICGTHLMREDLAKKHMRNVHKEPNTVVTSTEQNDRYIINATRKTQNEMPIEKTAPKRKLSGPKVDAPPAKRKYEPQEIDLLPINPILDHLVYCSRCEFSTKVRLNMVRHLQQHAEQQPVAQTAPVNPVPHLETNEKHFDRMVNLASSSIVNRTPDKNRPEQPTSVTLLIPPEAASRYPKYVPERQRHTCGAKGCSYISVDDAMLRYHWDTLHAGTTDFHCVHCPPHQHLDTSKPLTATRILAHLKMHDATLFACSSCSYYHFKREAVEKHLSEIHKGGKLMVVREESSRHLPVASPGPSSTSVSAPTMDLKPWQCGLCKYKSMLRPEVADHCSKIHQSKMQFKCGYCPFRTSAIENVIKHQTNSHAGKAEDVFYYYYREGSVADEADGTPRWMKQRQKTNTVDTEVKLESSVFSAVNEAPPAVITPLTIDLQLVKKEVPDVPGTSAVRSIEDLCKIYGQFCEPNGIKYKCPLCTVVMEDTKEGMQSHLYEELNYRKWSCGLCSYKAFHKTGLTDHMSTEHRRQYDHVVLPTDFNIERWVSAFLSHQTTIITKHKENLIKQKIVIENKPGPSTEIAPPKVSVSKYSDKDLETSFGGFGTPTGAMFCCAKCTFITKEEGAMRDHLEMELNMIRWGCSNCSDHFQTYHEARFHCKGHDGPSRPVEAVRDPAMRAAWVATALQHQKKIILNTTATPSSSLQAPSTENSQPDNDNSLLVVRYEEKVPTPEEVNAKRKRMLQETDDRLATGEPICKKKRKKQCPYCGFKADFLSLVKIHMLSHFNLEPYNCTYCNFSGKKKAVYRHIALEHPTKPPGKMRMTEVPPDAKTPGDIEVIKVVCLICEKSMTEADSTNHFHNNMIPEFTKLNMVVMCCLCSALCPDTRSLQYHQAAQHPNENMKYSLYKIGADNRENIKCSHCNAKFKQITDYRIHHQSSHNTLPFRITSFEFTLPASDISNEGTIVPKRCARKSTTKLPNSIAKKSTTKLPYSVPSYDEEYSFYGTKPPFLEEYSNVTTLMSFCNMMVPFSMKQLSEHLNIEPKVLVSDINKK